ncbi:MAG: amidohydrolase family protein [Magnetospirillum sp.]|nr:amidohydrolase family protein [Magnetospirillum sp.]
MTATIVDADWILEGFAPDDAPILHSDAALAVVDGRVTEILPQAEARKRYPRARREGGKGRVAIPGLINAHHHVGATPLQLGSPDHPLELWFASRLALRDVDPRLDTLYAAFEMIESGVTTVQHLHSRAPGTPEQIVAAGRRVLDAYREIGMRASYSMALRDQNRLVYEDDAAFVARLPDALKAPMREYFDRFTLPLDEQRTVFEALRASVADERLLAVQIAPANLHWLSDKALGLAVELSTRHGLPMHMHLLETPYQKAYAAKRTGGSALAHIHRLGLTGPRLTIGHGVWMTEADIDLCAATGTHVCHNCSSNLRLKSGVAPLNRFVARGIPVALGLDEAGINDDRDMLQEMRLALRLHREPGIDSPHPTPSQILRMASERGAATTPFGSRIGRLAPGCEADVVLFDWDAVTRPYQNPDISPIDVLVQRAKSAAVKTVMIAGETVYRDGTFTRVDKTAVLDEIAAFFGRPLTDAEQARRRLARDVFPHVKAFYAGYLDGLGNEPFYRPSGRY